MAICHSTVTNTVTENNTSIRVTVYHCCLALKMALKHRQMQGTDYKLWSKQGVSFDQHQVKQSLWKSPVGWSVKHIHKENSLLKELTV